MEALISSGSIAERGSFTCESCGYVLRLDEGETLPNCPRCNQGQFTKASLFTMEFASPSVEPEADTSPAASEDWVQQARIQAQRPGQYIVFCEHDTVIAVAIENEWVRVGRSLAADVRFDDPTVSRRHALVVRQPDGVKVLDDRSLNGVFVNGKRVEWSKLTDGDEIMVGRHQLFFLDTVA